MADWRALFCVAQCHCFLLYHRNCFFYFVDTSVTRRFTTAIYLLLSSIYKSFFSSEMQKNNNVFIFEMQQ